jgi:hypothetical protein
MSEFSNTNLYNIDKMKKLIEITHDVSFSKLYDYQKDAGGMERYIIPLSKYIHQSPYSIIYNLKEGITDGSKRLIYIRSSIKNTVISYSDMIKNATSFDKIPLVFIGGELYTNFSIKISGDNTYFYFNMRLKGVNSAYNNYTWEEFQTIISSYTNMHVILVPSMNVKQRVNLKTSDMLLNVKTGLALNTFTSLNKKNTNVTPFPFITNSKYTFKYVLTDPTINTTHIIYTKDYINSITETSVKISIFYINSISKTIKLPTTDEYFSLDIVDMPVPIENMLIFKKVGNKYLYDPDTTITMYYPNIYKVNRSSATELMIYVLYKDINNKDIGSKYKDEIRLYQEYTSSLINQYKDGSIPDMIKEYIPLDVTFNSDDFLNSEVYPDRELYIQNKFMEVITKNGNIFKKYLTDILPNRREIYISVDKINLANRLRNNNKKEFPNAEVPIIFPSPQYLFKFIYSGLNDKMNIWVDGVFTIPTILTDSKYQYVYLPVSKIKSTSIILVERFYESEYKQDLTYSNTTDYVEVSLNEPLRLCDIFITKEDVNGIVSYLYDNQYKIYIKKDDVYLDINEYKFSYADTIYINFLTDEYTSYTINVRVSNVNIHDSVIGNREVNLNGLIGNISGKTNLFLNGRLLLIDTTELGYNLDNAGDTHIFRYISLIKPTDEITVLYTPTYREKILEIDLIDENGYINLEGVISKPFDLKWFDVFINGLRLSKYNIEYISPYKIMIKNINTRKHLLIYEKYFDEFNITSEDVTDNLLNNFQDILDDIIGENSIPDDLSDIGEVILEVLPIIEEFLLELDLINPDVLQFSRVITQQKHYMFDDNHILFVNPDDTDLDITDDYIFNPDTNENTI